jgi:hypothetical protein
MANVSVNVGAELMLMLIEPWLPLAIVSDDGLRVMLNSVVGPTVMVMGGAEIDGA